VVKGEQHRAVPAGREADERATAPIRDRAEVPVDVGRHLLGDRRLPVPPGAPVEVLRITVAVARTLGCHQNRARAQAVEGAREEADVTVGNRRCRQAVEEVDNGVALVAGVILRRQVNRERKRAAEGG
jgi:hypothetical protein